MTARYLGVLSGADWHAARRWRVGGSDIGPIVGLSPHTSAEEVLDRKLTGADSAPSAAMLRGQCLESGVLAYAAAKWGHVADPPRAGTYIDGEHDALLYNPDGITADGLLLEVKTTTNRCEERGWGRAGTDQVPHAYGAQVQYGMALLGLDVCHLIVLHGATNGRPDLSFARYTIRHNPEVSTALRNFALRWHAYHLAPAMTAVAA